ncbi:hypothetical protein [Actinomyces minihominis]|uniref:hypothetical protein n=1 Tax=Actinomyces minihominis TaxID=2002838 RepID=UPI001A912BA7|nr:hypothetical protein [Actinomyces minihominis]
MELNDAGMQLFGQRERTVDLLDLIEFLVNSIARTSKSFDADFVEIKTHKQDFSSLTQFAENELATVRKSAVGAGAGVATGASVAAIAPTAAMWVATTFGTASTGAAISSLSGAAEKMLPSHGWVGGPSPQAVAEWQQGLHSLPLRDLCGGLSPGPRYSPLWWSLPTRS